MLMLKSFQIWPQARPPDNMMKRLRGKKYVAPDMLRRLLLKRRRSSV